MGFLRKKDYHSITTSQNNRLLQIKLFIGRWSRPSSSHNSPHAHAPPQDHLRQTKMRWWPGLLNKKGLPISKQHDDAEGPMKKAIEEDEMPIWISTDYATKKRKDEWSVPFKHVQIRARDFEKGDGQIGSSFPWILMTKSRGRLMLMVGRGNRTKTLETTRKRWKHELFIRGWKWTFNGQESGNHPSKRSETIRWAKMVS